MAVENEDLLGNVQKPIVSARKTRQIFLLRFCRFPHACYGFVQKVRFSSSEKLLHFLLIFTFMYEKNHPSTGNDCRGVGWSNDCRGGSWSSQHRAMQPTRRGVCRSMPESERPQQYLGMLVLYCSVTCRAAGIVIRCDRVQGGLDAWICLG